MELSDMHCSVCSEYITKWIQCPKCDSLYCKNCSMIIFCCYKFDCLYQNFKKIGKLPVYLLSDGLVNKTIPSLYMDLLIPKKVDKIYAYCRLKYKNQEHEIDLSKRINKDWKFSVMNFFKQKKKSINIVEFRKYLKIHFTTEPEVINSEFIIKFTHNSWLSQKFGVIILSDQYLLFTLANNKEEIILNCQKSRMDFNYDIITQNLSPIPNTIILQNYKLLDGFEVSLNSTLSCKKKDSNKIVAINQAKYNNSDNGILRALFYDKTKKNDKEITFFKNFFKKEPKESMQPIYSLKLEFKLVVTKNSNTINGSSSKNSLGEWAQKSLKLLEENIKKIENNEINLGNTLVKINKAKYDNVEIKKRLSHELNKKNAYESFSIVQMYNTYLSSSQLLSLILLGVLLQAVHIFLI